LTATELRGADLFAENGCAVCHRTQLQIDAHANNGLDAILTDPGDHEGSFSAASLRNIAVTSPYMHDGRFATLREVIDHYDHGVVDAPFVSPVLRESGNGPIRRLFLSEFDKNALEAFLRTLTDYEMLTDPKFADPF
jgi:cytochrome c peroxidase